MLGLVDTWVMDRQVNHHLTSTWEWQTETTLTGWVGTSTSWSLGTSQVKLILLDPAGFWQENVSFLVFL